MNTRVGVCVVLSGLVMVACASSDSISELSATEASELHANPYLAGGSLRPGVLALTFDDGPGDRTAELSTYLRARGIRAAFFVVGENIPGRESVLAQLRSDGHLVANHTENHLDLTAESTSSVVHQVTATDARIAPYQVSSDPWLFRAPMGYWNDHTFDALVGTPMNKYVGPIYWDIGGAQDYPRRLADWACWQVAPQRTTSECAGAYMNDITSIGRGIVLMHDPHGWTRGNTVDMVKLLVPRLQRRGYTFVRVDEVPAIAALARPSRDAGTD